MNGKYRKLFLIGNGFDRWQGLSTSYDQFRKYYRSNIRAAAEELHIKTTVNEAGDLITPVEMIYGEIFSPETLPEEFFWNFESSTALLDDQNIINYFGKSDRGLYNLQETVREAREILQKIFGDWINSVVIDPADSGYRFDDSCYFINFNYTDTLQKRFGVDQKNDYHIHGEADDPENIVFGHSTHPETAFQELMEQKLIRTLDGKKSKRLRGLYLIEELCMLKEVRELPSNCSSILGAADYIDGGHAPRKENARWHISYYSDEDKKRIERVMQRTGCDNFELHQGIDECIMEFKV